MSTGLDISFQLQTIGAVVIAALLAGALASKMGLSSSIGYILAGVLLGPLGLNFLFPDSAVSVLFSELGIILLLFYLGLEMSLSKFRETGAVATLIAFVQMLSALVAGFFVAKLFGFGDLEALVIASLLPMASTVMAVKFMLERGIIHTLESRVAISVLIIEDFAAILVLVFLNSLSSQQSINIAVLNGLLFVVFVYYLVEKVSKHVLNILKSVGHEDKAAIYAISIGLIVSELGGRLGLSSVLGAYFAGFALAESEFGERIKKEVGFFREFFILFFFVSFGAAASVPSSPSIFLLMLALVAAYVVVMTVSFGVMGSALGFSPSSAVTMGLTLAAIGEFSLIIAGFARKLSEAGPLASQLPHAGDILSLAFLLTVATSFLMPFLFNRSEQITRVFLLLYPPFARKAMEGIGRGMRALEQTGKEPVFKSHAARALQALAGNFIIVIAIVYISSLKEVQVPVEGIPFLPPYATMGMLILPLVIWPLYRIVNELKILAHKVSESAVARAFPELSKSLEIEHRVSDIFTGMILTLSGFGASVFVFYATGASVILLAPALFTLISMMYLSKSFYGLMEHYEAIETGMAAEQLTQNKRLHELSREFNEHTRRLRALHLQRMQAREEIEQAIKDEDVDRARFLLVRFKRSEARQITQLLSAEQIIRTLPQSILSRYPAYSRKFSRFSAKSAFKEYLQRHALNKKELEALQESRGRREEIEKGQDALHKIKQYLAARKPGRLKAARKALGAAEKKIAKAKPSGKKAFAFAPLKPEIKRQEDELEKKLRVLPKLPGKFINKK